MFGKPYRVTRIFGIDLTVSWSFLLLLAGLSIVMALRSGSVVLGLLTGTVSLALVFSSVLVHELAHALVARRLGVTVDEIELHFFGGAAKMLEPPKSPRDEMLIAGAGPAASFGLALAFWSFAAAGVESGGVVMALATLNLLLGAFNLVPALPTDGGRILRAALETRHGALEATRLAVKVARIATVGLGIYGLITGQPFLAAIAVFLWFLGTRELRLAEWSAGAGRAGGRSEPRRTNPGAERVEVFDRHGRLVGLAPGGAVETKREPVAPPHEPRTVPRFDPWGGGAASFGRGPGRAFSGSHHRDSWRAEAGARVVVRGPDGRLWVVG
jgi:Zn-dependent protease